MSNIILDSWSQQQLPRGASFTRRSPEQDARIAKADALLEWIKQAQKEAQEEGRDGHPEIAPQCCCLQGFNTADEAHWLRSMEQEGQEEGQEERQGDVMQVARIAVTSNLAMHGGTD